MNDTITEAVHLFKMANTVQTFFYTFTLLLFRFGLDEQRQKIYSNNWKWYKYLLILFSPDNIIWALQVSFVENNMICEYNIDPKKKGHIWYLCDSSAVKEIQAEKKTLRKISRNIEKPRDKSPDPCYIKFMKYSTERAEASSPWRHSDVDKA